MAKRTARQNEVRRLRHKSILSLTGNKALAEKARDWSNKTYNKRLSEYDLPSKNIDTYLLPEKPVRQKRIKKAVRVIKTVKKENKLSLEELVSLDEKQFKSRQERYKVFYNVIREAGYTPKEARKLKTKKSEELADLFKANKVLDREDRKARWKALSKKGKKLDPYIVDLAEQVNIDNGFDVSARYGYGIVYAWYINGGDIKTYIANIYPDNQIPDIYYGMSKYNF